MRLEHIGALPSALAAFNRRDIDQMELIVEAALTGDRRTVLQAMLLDPVTDSVRSAEAILDEMLPRPRRSPARVLIASSHVFVFVIAGCVQPKAALT